ncbi:MAG: dihydrofolate reductase, partial [Bradyrhizobium sp.]
MLANADHVMPDELKFEADKKFFAAALDRADLIVHGRHSREDQPGAPKRKRIILTRRVRT